MYLIKYNQINNAQSSKNSISINNFYYYLGKKKNVFKNIFTIGHICILLL